MWCSLFDIKMDGDLTKALIDVAIYQHRLYRDFVVPDKRIKRMYEKMNEKLAGIRGLLCRLKELDLSAYNMLEWCREHLSPGDWDGWLRKLTFVLRDFTYVYYDVPSIMSTYEQRPAPKKQKSSKKHASDTPAPSQGDPDFVKKCVQHGIFALKICCCL